jgi:NAD(P)-dependent dehydrogenase (short-subunit alcohol dehydrogenase family)
MAQRFSGRRALITGAASGIGRATAERLVAEGAKVAVLDVDAAGAESAARALGPQALALVADEAAVEAAFTSVIQAYPT